MARRARERSDDPVANRLILSRIALGYENQGDYAMNAGLLPNRYNAYETTKRPLTKEAARLLYIKYGLTMEWLFDGVPDRLPHGLVLRLMALGAIPQTPPPALQAEKIIRKPRR